MCNLCVIYPPEICVNLVFKHIHAEFVFLSLLCELNNSKVVEKCLI